MLLVYKLSLYVVEYIKGIDEVNFKVADWQIPNKCRLLDCRHDRINRFRFRQRLNPIRQHLFVFLCRQNLIRFLTYRKFPALCCQSRKNAI